MNESHAFLKKEHTEDAHQGYNISFHWESRREPLLGHWPFLKMLGHNVITHTPECWSLKAKSFLVCPEDGGKDVGSTGDGRTKT